MDNFYHDEFERYLKDQADQFKLEPSKKTWHGIYNNFHPGRRWPSVATGLMIILLLTLTNNLNIRQQAELTEAYNKANPEKQIKNNSANKVKSRNVSDVRDADAIWEKNMITDLFSLTSPETTVETTATADLDSKPDPNAITIISDSRKNINKEKSSSTVTLPKAPVRTSSIEGVAQNDRRDNKPVQVLVEALKDEALPVTLISGNFISSVPVDVITAEKIPSIKSMNSNLKKSESVATILKRFKRSRTNWTIYISPTLNYRKIYNTISPSADATYINAYNAGYSDINNATSNHIAPGLEIGTNINFRVLKNLQFFTGLQFNYSGYNATASHTHPVLSSLTLVQNGIARSEPALSYYSNDFNESAVTLHNYSVDASVPVGLKYKLVDKDRIYVNVMSAFLPSLSLKDRSYFLSADSHYYIAYPDLKRHMNINSEFGASIGFKFSKLKYEIGPEFRYEMLSNFKKSSPYSEHLLNYGIRFSISN